MENIVQGLSLITKIHGWPISKSKLMAEVSRQRSGRIDWQSMTELLSSHGFDNEVSRRELYEIPEEIFSVLLLLADETSVVVDGIDRFGLNSCTHSNSPLKREVITKYQAF